MDEEDEDNFIQLERSDYEIMRDAMAILAPLIDKIEKFVAEDEKQAREKYEIDKKKQAEQEEGDKENWALNQKRQDRMARARELDKKKGEIK